VTNVRILDPPHEPLPENESFDFITTFDVIHDSTHPADLISAIRKSLTPDGTWLCADVIGMPTFADNPKSNPIAPLAYCFSVMVCMSAALSVPGGAGLGTLGFHEQTARTTTARAGDPSSRLGPVLRPRRERARGHGRSRSPRPR
jgi:hypothetical protein